MPKTSRTRVSADEIADKASRGEDVSAYFTNKFTVVRPVRRVNVDLTPGMLRQLDASDALSIAVMPIPDDGLGAAINDRLTRAATR